MNTLQNSLVKTFTELIKIDEIYGEENKIIAYIQNVLHVNKVRNIQDKFGNIIAFLPGVGEPLMLNTHIDIPENVPHLEFIQNGDIISATGKSILGADPKSGLAVLLQLIRVLNTTHKKTRPLEFVFTIGEEAGLHGARNLDYSLISAKEGLVLDEDGPCTNIVIKAPAFHKLDCKILGKTVHTRDWKDGINAIAVVGKIISKLRQGEIIKDVTFNIGLITGGTARNSVSGEAVFNAEFRSFDTKKLIKAVTYVENIINDTVKSFGTSAIIDSEFEFDGYKLEKKHKLFESLEKTFQKLNLKPNYYETFGGSDANIFNAHGIMCVPIGSAYYLAHRYDEYVKISEMEQLLNFLFEFSKDKKQINY